MGALSDGRSDRLRLLVVCDYYAAGSAGGIERATQEVVRRLIEEFDVDVRVVGANPRSQHPPSGTDPAAVPVRGLDLSHVLGAQALLAPGLRRAIRRTIRGFRPDVIMVAGIHSPAARTAARLRFPVPIAVVVHVGSLRALPWLQRTLGRLHDRWVGRRLLRRADAVMAVSDAAAAHAAQLGAIDPVVVPNGVDTEVFRPGTRSEDEVLVVFLGRLIGNKGPMLALEAFAAAGHPSMRLVFAGEGPLRRRLQARASRLRVAHRVEFAGLVKNPAELLAQADIVVRPSMTEGRSLTILEAMAAGACVIASDIPANREILAHDENGLLHRVGDTRELAEHLAAMAGEPARRRELGGRARQQVIGHGWDATARQTKAVLEDILRP